MRKAYVKPGVKVRIKIPDTPQRIATVVRYEHTRYSFDGRIFEIEYANGHRALVNEYWMRKDLRIR